METSDLNTKTTQECGSTVTSKRRYLIGYLSKNELGQSVISPISPVQFFSPPPGFSIARTFGLPTVKPGKSNTPKARATKIRNGRSRRNSGAPMDLEN